MDLLSAVHASWPGVAHVSQLRQNGVQQKHLERAVRLGDLVRVRRGWYATPRAPIEIVRAVRLGGALTSESAAKQFGLWVPGGARLHVSLPANATGYSLPKQRSAFCVHWRRTPGAVRRPIEEIAETLRQAVECLTEEMAVTLIDSALHERTDDVTVHDLEECFAPLGERYRRALSKADARSASGIETLVRLRLRARGIRVRAQVSIPRVGCVDLVIGDRLVIETDGRQFHDTVEAFATDRERDLELFAAGYERLRLTYAHVMYRWHEVGPIILAKVRARNHLVRSRRR